MSWGSAARGGNRFSPSPFTHITGRAFFLMNLILILTLVIQINFPCVCARLFLIVVIRARNYHRTLFGQTPRLISPLHVLPC